jgi:hypothetical protein
MHRDSVGRRLKLQKKSSNLIRTDDARRTGPCSFRRCDAWGERIMGFAATAHICALNWTRLGSAGGFDHPSQLHDRCLRSVFAPDRGRNRFAFKAPRPEARIEADGGVALHRGVSNADVTSMPLPQDKCGNKRAIARRKGRISCFSRMDMGTIVNKPRPKAADATDRGMPAGPFVSHESTQSYLVQGHLIRLRHPPPTSFRPRLSACSSPSA